MDHPHRHGVLPLPCLMLLVETTLPDGGPLDPVVVAAMTGGVNTVQLRDHATLPEDLEMAALDLRDITRGRARLIVNDAPETALRLRLDGVHLPEAAFDIDRAEIRWPFLVGRSVHSVDSALRAQEGGADYLVAGNIFETDSHPGKDGVGIEFLHEICAAAHIPVLAIGGITAANTPECIAAGARGVAVRSGILLADDPRAAAHTYRQALDAAWIAGEYI